MLLMIKGLDFKVGLYFNGNRESVKNCRCSKNILTFAFGRGRLVKKLV